MGMIFNSVTTDTVTTIVIALLLGGLILVILVGHESRKTNEQKEKAIRSLFKFMATKYQNREDEDNIYGVGMSDKEFRQFIIDCLLGEDWYVADLIGQTQINEIALIKILEKYSKEYKKVKREIRKD